MKNKKQLAGKILKISPKKIKFKSEALEDIKKAITRSDFRGLIAIGSVFKKDTNHQSKAGARKIKEQKKKGRRKGVGTRKGSKNSVVGKKEKWMAKVRVQRQFIKELKEKELLTPTNYRNLYRKVSGGYFRNRRHIKLYVNEYNLINKNDKNGN
jgi:large subunit ribosomal protein L19e